MAPSSVALSPSARELEALAALVRAYAGPLATLPAGQPAVAATLALFR
jgi:hypothetical protein